MSRARALSILGLDASADEDDYRDAYRRIVKSAHPDRGGDTDRFVRVTRAYDRLSSD